MTFVVGDWVVLPPYGVGRVASVTERHATAPGRRAYVVVWDAPGILLDDYVGDVARVEAIGEGSEGNTPKIWSRIMSAYAHSDRGTRRSV